MKNLVKPGMLIGLVIALIGVAMLATRGAKKAEELLTPEREAEMMRGMDEAEVNSARPADWDFCHDPSYYIRACELGPYTQRWSGPPGGTCPTIAICGAHTKPCGGDDGITNAMMDQGGTRYYPIPHLEAGNTIRELWRQCYENKQNIWGAAYPCSTAPVPSGEQAPPMKTWDQLPEGPQKIAWGKKYGCGPYAPSPTAGTPPPPTSSVTVPPACPTCAPVCTTATRTPQIGPARTHTPTITPHIGPNVTRTHTKIPVPVTRTPA